MHTDIGTKAFLPRNAGLLKSFQERRKWRNESAKILTQRAANWSAEIQKRRKDIALFQVLYYMLDFYALLDSALILSVY